jgi:RimJ/RimL family protein N-acetyltransferase
LLRHAFDFVDRVIFLVNPQNLRSRRAVEKIGGVERSARVERNGRESVVYEITRERFRANLRRIITELLQESFCGRRFGKDVR